MKRILLLAAALVGTLTAAAQTAPKPFPQGVFAAKTIAIVNDTKQPGVEKGAATALTSWGQFKVVDDPQLADVVLRFEKTTHHEGRATHKPDTDQSTSSGYEFSVNSTISMKVFYIDAEDPFFSTKTGRRQNQGRHRLHRRLPHSLAHRQPPLTATSSHGGGPHLTSLRSIRGSLRMG